MPDFISDILNSFASKDNDDTELLSDLAGAIAKNIARNQLRKARARRSKPRRTPEEVFEEPPVDVTPEPEKAATSEDPGPFWHTVNVMDCIHQMIEGGVKAAPIPQMRDEQGNSQVSWQQTKAQFTSEAIFLYPIVTAILLERETPSSADSNAIHQFCRMMVLARHNLGVEGYDKAYGEDLVQLDVDHMDKILTRALG